MKFIILIINLITTNVAYGWFYPPICKVNHQSVMYIPVDTATLRSFNVGFAMATTDINGYPVVLYDKDVLATLDDELAIVIFYHECAHHQLGHVALNLGFQNQNQLLENEQQADCVAGKLIAKYEHYYNVDKLRELQYDSRIRQLFKTSAVYQPIAQRLRSTIQCMKEK